MARGSDFLGPYRLVKLIRAGQTSQVWEAIKDPEPVRIAVKVLLQDKAGDKTAIEHLQREAEVGNDLDDRYVIKIFEYNGSHGRPFVAMELFNGRNLKQMLREQPERLAYNMQDVVRRCAKGLRYLHEQGWIHADVKPDNYLMNDKNRVKLIDFSIAQKAKKGGGLNSLFGMRSKTIRGTRSYMAPEQIRGQQLTVKTDIYSFGCTIFELLAGKPPFTANNPDELLHRHLTNAAPTVQAQNNAISLGMAELIQQMMAKDPAKRPESLQQFLKLYSKIRVYRAGMRPDPPVAAEEE